MDLPQGKIRVLEVELLRAPTIGLLLDYKFQDLHCGARNCGHAIPINDYVLVAC
jgi:hypothetical protein